MKAIDALSDLTGFYVLTPKGELGAYGPNKEFIVDERLTKAFAAHNANYLRSYSRDPDKKKYRLAIIYHSSEKKAWGSDTLILEEHVVRELYPVGGSHNKELTAFQKKNREKSVYRGMELLLEYRNELNPDALVYCPVLLDIDTALDQYITMDNKAGQGGGNTPVFEVHNLIETIPVGKRDAPAILELKEKIYKGIIKKSRRKSGDMTLLDRIDVGGNPWSAHDAYSDVDKRADREIIIHTVNSLADSNIYWQDLRDSGFIERLERWLEKPPEPPSQQILKAFITFRDMDEDKLSMVAENSLVFHVPPGAPLLERGKTDNWNLYLIEGTVELVAADGVQRFIEGGTENAASAISFLRPRMYTVSAYTRVEFLWAHDDAVKNALNSTTPPGDDLKKQAR